MGKAGRDEEQQRREFFFKLAGQTDVIVTAIAEGLSIKDLKNFRSVSHSFYRATLTPWRRKTVLRLNFTVPLLNKVCRPKYHRKKLTLREALDLPIRKDDMLKLEKYPYTSFQIFYWKYRMGENHETEDELFKQFFIKWGTYLHHLDLRNCKSVGARSMIRALKYAQNLKTLALNDCNGVRISEETDSDEEEEETVSIKGLTVTQLTIDAFSEWKDAYNAETLINAILRELPLLKELKIHLQYSLLSLSGQAQPGIMKSLQIYREQVGNGLLQVKILGIVEFNGSVDELLEATLPLERWHAVVERGFQNIFRIKARKLVQLFVHQNETIPRNFNVCYPGFPFDIVVPVLLEMRLYGKITNSFNFLNFMPALKCVKIRFHQWEDDLLYSIHTGSDETNAGREIKDFVENTLEIYKVSVEMQYLKHLEIDCFLKMKSLPVLKKLIPNLTVLRMVVQSNEMFRFICENWPNLIKFGVEQGSRVDDDGITGVEQGEETMQFSNLTSLKHLKFFEISSRHVLTDLSVNQAFACMKNLTKLRIHRPTKFSRSSKRWLDDKFGDWRIT